MEKILGDDRFFIDFEVAKSVQEDLSWMKAEARASHIASWKKLKCTLDPMEFYDLITWWYELEIKTAWHRYCTSNESGRAGMEERCRRILAKGTDIMAGAPRYKLRLRQFHEGENTSLKQFLRQMHTLRNNPIANGIVLGRSADSEIFNMFDNRFCREVRKEIIRRFLENRANAAKSATS